MENKKIKNATKVTSNDIKFKSRLEEYIYKALLSEGIKPEYEKETYTLYGKHRSRVPFYNRTKKLGFHLDYSPLRRITYTPDFTFELNGIKVIIEVKGFQNDTFPLKRNMFRRVLEEEMDVLKRPIMYFEVHSKGDLLKALDIVRKEDSQTINARCIINWLPDKYIPYAYKLLSERKFEELDKLIEKIKNEKP